MKYIFALFLVILSFQQVGPERKFVHTNLNLQFEKFMKAYEHVRKWEGNYSNLIHDSGGETYAGITRKFNGEWDGWEELDKYKKSNNVKWNSFIPEMEVHVKSYYYNEWKKGHYDQINDQTVAAYLFDYRNTGIIAIKHAQQILIRHGYKIKLNFRMDINTVTAINKMNPKIFLDELMESRKDFYYNVTVKKPEMEIYLKGWINRAESIIS